MKFKGKFVLKKLSVFYAVVPVDDSVNKFNCMITLNESGALLWETLGLGADEKGLVSVIKGEYNIDDATAEKDVSVFLEKLKTADIIE